MQINSFVIGEDPGKNRVSIFVNDKEIRLPHKSWLCLQKLAAARKTGENEGWLHRLDIEDGDNQYSYFYLHRLHKQLLEHIRGADALIVSDRTGKYRLEIDPSIIEIL